MAKLHAGAAQLDITPLIGTTMPTLFNPKTSTGIHDPLHSKALVLQAGDVTIAFACLDLLVIPAADVQRARSIVEGRCGIPSENILISATHTHSCAGPGGDFGVDLKPPEYHRWLGHRIADSITMACQRLQPAKIDKGVGKLPQHVHNRRYHMTDGSVKMNPGRQSPAVVKPAGPTDPAVTVVVVVDENDRPIALMGNYALHYVGGVAGPVFSADYYGAVGRCVNEMRRAEFPVLWTNGCSGDINNIDVFSPATKREPFEQIELVAQDAAEEAIRIWNAMSFTDDVELATLIDRFDVPLRRPGEAELAEAKDRYEEGPQAKIDREWALAKEMVLTSQMSSPEQAEVQAHRINDLAVVSLPGEVFCQIGLDIRAKSPFDTTMPIGLANGYIGYIPTPVDFELGGYETWLARSSRCAPEVGAMLSDKAAALLERLAE